MKFSTEGIISSLLMGLTTLTNSLTESKSPGFSLISMFSRYSLSSNPSPPYIEKPAESGPRCCRASSILVMSLPTGWSFLSLYTTPAIPHTSIPPL